MTSNFLQLNEDKTEILVISKMTVIDKRMPSISTRDGATEAASTAKNLGVIFNKTMNIDAHINATYRRAFWENRNIGRIKSFFNEKVPTSLVHSFVC